MKRIHWILIAVLTALTMLAQVTMVDPEHSYWWDRFPGFWAVFGFVGCVVITYFAKSLGKHLLQREEDYYDER